MVGVFGDSIRKVMLVIDIVNLEVLASEISNNCLNYNSAVTITTLEELKRLKEHYGFTIKITSWIDRYITLREAHIILSESSSEVYGIDGDGNESLLDEDNIRDQWDSYAIGVKDSKTSIIEDSEFDFVVEYTPDLVKLTKTIHDILDKVNVI